MTDDLSVALRYRPYFKRNSGNIGKDNTMDKGYTLTGNIDYTFLKDYTIGYELEYKKGTSGKTILSDNDNYDITHNVKLSYKWDKTGNRMLKSATFPVLKPPMSARLVIA